jgi:branched-chain amino acid transport system permease protein
MSSVAADMRKPSEWPAMLRPYAILGAVLAAGLLVILSMGSNSLTSALAPGIINAIAATSLGFLIRQSGLVSFGHALHFGLGAYAFVILKNSGIVPVEVAMLSGVLLPPLLMLVIGPVLLRAGGITFSLLTLAVAQSVYEVSLKWRFLTNGDDGITLRLPKTIFGVKSDYFVDPQSMAAIAWVILILVIAGLMIQSRTHAGRLAIAIKNNQERANFLGYGVLWPKLLTLVLSSAVAALAGVLFALYNLFISPDVLQWGKSGDFLIMAIVGGSAAVGGPAVGALVFFLARNAIGDVSDHWIGLMGVLVILVTMTMPNGVFGSVAVWLRNRRNR